MKLALIMYGHMRTYEKCFPFLKDNLLSIHNPDVFIHTWDERESSTVSWHNRHMEDKSTLSDEEREKIKEWYNPVAIEFGTQDPPEEDSVTENNGVSVSGQMYMYASMNRAAELKSIHERHNDFKYDAVIKLRPDIKIAKKFEFGEINEDEVVIVGNRGSKEFSQNMDDYRACDIINVATSATMTEICTIQDFKKYFIDGINNDKVVHSGFVGHLVDLGLDIRFLDYSYPKDWTIVRDK